MADKAIVDKAISDLTQALQIANEDLFVLEQNGEAKKLKGETLLDFVTLSVVSVTVTTLPAGSSATATYDKSTGTLALGIPQGSKGDTGATGATGPANVLTIGSVTSGKVASATITGEAPNQVLNLVLEKGEKGDKGDKGEKGNAFTYADFTPDQLAALKGEKGDTGSQGEPGPPGKDGGTPEIVEGELVEVPSAGGGTDLSLGITGATVGQIAKITAVDTDGKPTAWEPVDMPSGGGGGKRLLYRHNISQDTVLTTDSFDTSGANIDLSVYSHLYIRGMFICNSPKETYGRLYLNGTYLYQIQYFNRKIGQTVGFEADIICLKTQNKSSAGLLSFAWCSQFNLENLDNFYVASGTKNPRVNDNLQSIGFSAAESADIFAVKAGSYVEVWGD